MTKEQFIEEIATAAKKYAPNYGISVISPIVAQACLESAYGTSSKAQYHNYFGLKYRKNRVTCNSGYFQDGSQEQKADGSYYPVTDDWYAFATLEDGVEGYFQFINIDRYSNLKGITDPKKYLETIKADGYATSINYVNNVYNIITTYNLIQYDTKDNSNNNSQKENVNMGYTNSSLVTCTVKSPNHSGTRTHSIDRITPHCVVGQLSASSIGGCFTSSSRQASCNYGIGTEGGVCLVVDESNRSWCSSSNANDQRAITIECASDKTSPYAFNDTVYNKLIELCADICKRNGKTKLLWLGDKNTTLNYSPKSNEMVLTVHRWFAAKSCPGDWLMERMDDLAEKVTAKLGGSSSTSSSSSGSSTQMYRVRKSWDDAATQKGAYTNLANAKKCADNYTGYSVYDKDGNVVYSNGTSTSSSSSSSKTFSEGDVITLKDDATYASGGTIPKWVLNSTLYYRGKNNQGIIFSTQKTGAITGVVKEDMVNGTSTSSSSASKTTSASYVVKVTASALNIRKGPGTNYAITGVIKDKGCYTIIAESNGWGKLKSGVGYINLSYTEKV